IRQKSRWTLGIAYQGNENIPWSGSIADRYFLLRDRKGPLCSVLVVLATVVLFGFITYSLMTSQLPALFDRPVLKFLVFFNTFGMLIRLLQRMRAVYRVNGLSQALMVPVRWLVANVVNVLASHRAYKTYKHSVRTGTRPAWVKTDHQLPAHFGAPEVVAEAQSQ
ncbi:MAG TPA: hypothetical protein VN132_08785, partial [Bdellovibrio sp.]|nr:hypothetical protein [Bdellovibrio sp.]